MKFHSSQNRNWLSLLIFCLFTASGFAQAPPTFTQAFAPSTIGPGSTSTLVFTIDNTGSGTIPLPDMNFTSTFPSTIALAAVPDASTNCGGTSVEVNASIAGGTSFIAFTGGRLNAGGSCTVSVNVTSGTVGINTNPAVTLFGINNDPAVSNPTDLVVVSSSPGFSKNFDDTSVFLGETSTLTFTIDNSLNANRIGALDFTDILPTGMVIADPNNLSYSCGSVLFPNDVVVAVPGSSQVIADFNGSTFGPAGSEVLAAGSSCTLSVDILTVGTGADGQLNNVTEELLADFSSAGKASAGLGVTRGDPLHIIKSFTDDPAIPGGTVTLDLTIFNFSRGNTANSVAFTDDLTSMGINTVTYGSLLSNSCGGTFSGDGTNVSLSGGSVSAGSSCTVSISLDVGAGTVSGSYENTTGTVTGDVGGSTVTGNAATADLFVEFTPSFSQVFQDNPQAPGGLVDLIYTITNPDPSNDLTNVSFTDEFPTIIETASVTPVNGDCGVGSVFAFTPLFDPGGLSDIIPSTLSLSGGSIPAGSNCSFSITLDIPAGTAGGIYTNTTSALEGTLGGVELESAPAMDDLDVLFTPIIEKSFDVDVVLPGNQVDVTFELSLDYSELIEFGASAISFSDDLSAFLPGTHIANPNNLVTNCGGTVNAAPGSSSISLTGGTLAAGSNCSITITLDIDAGVTIGNYTNSVNDLTATVNGQTVFSRETLVDLLVTNLSFTQEFLGGPVLPGDLVTLRYTIDNAGTFDATGIQFTNSLSSTLSGLTAEAPLPVLPCGATGFSATSFINYTGGTVPAGTSCFFDVPVRIPAGAAVGSYINSTSNLVASINGSGIVLPPAADGFEVLTDLLEISKEFTNDPVAPGSTVDLSFTIINTDTAQTISDITFTDNLENVISGLAPAGVLPTNPCGAGSMLNFSNGALTLSSGTLNPGASCTFDMTLDVPSTASSGSFTSTSGAVSGTASPNGFTATGGTSTDLLEVIALSLSKVFSGAVGGVMETVDLTFTLENLGSGTTISNIKFFDNLDDMLSGTTILALPSNVDSCGPSVSFSGSTASTLAFDNGELSPGASCSFSITLQAPCNEPPGLYTNETSAVTVNGIFVAPAATAVLDYQGFDADGDGVPSCDGDCDDNNANNFPGNTEICDGQDNNCDGQVDEGFDLDGDGVTACGGDCDDNDPTVFPGAPELCDGIDNDCDGTIPNDEIDDDGDGFSECQGDCDDNNANAFPGNTETCDGLDNNCDGQVDEGLTFDLDGDGFTSIGSCQGSADDCDDNDASVFPGATEICDGLDNDCDGQVDEETPVVTIDENTVPSFCQGLAVLTAQVSNPIPVLTYAWSGGLSPEQEVTVLANGIYTVTVTNGTGCTATESITVDVDADEVLSGYVIVAKNKVETKESTVNGGGIGVTKNSGEAKLDNDSEVFTFVKANEVEVTGGSTAALVIEEKANLTLPPFRNNDFNDNNDIKVEQNETLTLTGSNYGKIEVEENGILIFDNPEIFVKEIKAKEEATIDFLQPCEMMVKGVVELDKKNSFNLSEQPIILYLKDKLSVEEESEVVGSFYTKKEVEAKGKSNNERTSMTGQFISLDEVKSDKYTDWNWSPNCYVPPPNGNLGEPSTSIANSVSSELAVGLYPNPTLDRMTIAFNKAVDETTEVVIYDQLGRMMWTQELAEGQQSVELDLADKRFASGVYFVNVSSGDQKAVQRLIILK